MYDIIIVGAGAAGFAAALYAGRYSLKTLIIGENVGGTGAEAHLIENWLGTENMTGVELLEKFRKHALKFGAELKEDSVVKIEKQKNSFVVRTEKEKFEAKTVVLATGMKHRKLEVKGEKEFLGKGLSYCFTCDGALFKNKITAVVGGSDAAVSGTLFLSEICRKVYLIYRGEKLRAEPVEVKKLLSKKNVEVIYNSNVSEVFGDKFVKGIELENKKNVSRFLSSRKLQGNFQDIENSKKFSICKEENAYKFPYNKKKIELEGVFIEIGLVPVAALAGDLGVKTDENGFIVTDEWQATNIPGVFAAGDIATGNKIKQLISAASDGATAAVGAYNYINRKKR